MSTVRFRVLALVLINNFLLTIFVAVPEARAGIFALLQRKIFGSNQSHRSRRVVYRHSGHRTSLTAARRSPGVASTTVTTIRQITYLPAGTVLPPQSLAPVDEPAPGTIASLVHKLAGQAKPVGASAPPVQNVAARVLPVDIRTPPIQNVIAAAPVKPKAVPPQKQPPPQKNAAVAPTKQVTQPSPNFMAALQNFFSPHPTITAGTLVNKSNMQAVAVKQAQMVSAQDSRTGKSEVRIHTVYRPATADAALMLTQQAAAHQPVGPAIAQRTVEHVVPQQPTEHVGVQRTDEHRVPQPRAEHSVGQRTDELIIAQRPVSTQRPVEHIVAQRPAKHVSARRPVEHVVARQPAGRVAASRPIEHLIAQQPLEQPRSEESTEIPQTETSPSISSEFESKPVENEPKIQPHFPGETSVTSDNAFSTRASWYGGAFEGRRTACGQRFDPNQMTAASRVLPFGSKVLVANPKTGRCCTVTINDRGPDVSGRDVDLSRAAAMRIGVTGVSPVICVTYASPHEHVNYSPVTRSASNPIKTNGKALHLVADVM